MNIDEIKSFIINYVDEVKKENIVEGVYSVFWSRGDKFNLSVVTVLEHSSNYVMEEKKIKQIFSKYEILNESDSIINYYVEDISDYKENITKVYDEYTLKLLLSGTILYDKSNKLNELKQIVLTNFSYKPLIHTKEISFDNIKRKG